MLSGKQEDIYAHAQKFWSAAGAAIQTALANDAGFKAARQTMREDEIADAREMALLLQEGGEVLKIQEILPKPQPHLSEDILWKLRESYDALAGRSPDVAPFVAVIAMNRLQRPWEALRLPLAVCRQTGDALISKTDMGLVGEILLGRMDALQAAILATRHPKFEADILVSQVASFAELSSAIVKEIEVRRDGEWGQRLLKERKSIGNVMDGFMDRAVKEFAAALPMQKGAGDFSRAVPVEKRESAMNYAKLVAGSRHFAAAACFAAKQKTANEELCNLLRRYIDDAVRELRSCDSARRPEVEAQLQLSAELAALLFSEEEAELIRRRARAALSTAA